MTLRRGLGAALALGALLAGCAPPPRPSVRLDTATLAQRFEVALAAREAAGAGLDGDARLWVSGTAFGDLPTMAARLAMIGPDACRLRISSAFGTALDVSARGDTLTALVPARRLALDLDRAGDTLGIRDPGTLAFRIWSAGWRPPAAAWREAVFEDSIMVVRWVEDGDSLRLDVGSNGRPTAIALRPPRRSELRCAYRGWTPVGGAAWPSWLEFKDDAGAVRVSCRLTTLRARPELSRDRLTLKLPANAQRLEWTELKHAIARGGGL